MTQPNSDFDELASTTIAEYQSELADNVTNHIPVYAYLKEHGGVKKVDGGTQILENMLYGDNNTVKWYDGYELLDVSASDAVTAANFAWKQLNGNVVFNGKEAMINEGRNKQIDLIEARTKQCEISLTNTMGAAIYAAGTESSGKIIGGLQALVAASPSTGVVGGINRATQSWWRNQAYDASDNSKVVDASTIQDLMNTTYRLCQRGADKPNLIIMGDTHYGYFETMANAKKLFTNDTSKAALSFSSYKFKGADVIYDPNATATYTYFLNLDYLRIRPHSKRNFNTAKDRMPVNQDATIIPIFWMGNLTSSNSSLQGILTS